MISFLSAAAASYECHKRKHEQEEAKFEASIVYLSELEKERKREQRRLELREERMHDELIKTINKSNQGSFFRRKPSFTINYPRRGFSSPSFDSYSSGSSVDAVGGFSGSGGDFGGGGSSGDW